MSLGKVAAIMISVAGSGAVGAQTAHTKPDQIICAMSGSCDQGTTASDGRIAVGQEKSFSLVRPGAGAVTAKAAAPEAPSRRIASATPVHRAPMVKPASGRIDMLVSFPLGSAELTPSGKQEVQAFATAMASPALSAMRFDVEGHTDAVGNRDYNVDLSRRRAQSVVEYLSSLGVDRSRLEPQGYGFDKPRPGTKPRDPRNRRVEFVKAG